MTWEPPKKINGDLKNYVVRAKLVDSNEGVIDQRNYCDLPPTAFDQPETSTKVETKHTSLDTSKQPHPDLDGHCDCNTCALTCEKSQKEGDEQRQSSIDFEDEIQDLVYVKNEEVVKVERSKRQAIDTLTKKPFETKLNASASENIKNSDGEYLQFNEEFIKPNQLSVTLTSLSHYSIYQITVRACREKSKVPMPKNDKGEIEKDEECGPEVLISVLTMKKDENDLIPFFDATNVPSNETYGIIKVTWLAPPKPNGQILSYSIRFKKNDIEQSKWESVCITQKDYLNQTFYLLKPLSNGNYSVQIAATSVSHF